jgi:UDP-glucose 4-epimerase
MMNLSKKVLVTGGSGFIGSKIAEYCLKLGLSVRIFDLVKTSNPNIKESIIGSILDPYLLSSAIRGCDYVVHAAAAIGVERTETHRLECLYINIQGTVNVLDAAVKERIKKVLFMSSSEVYGDGDGKFNDENSALNPKSNYAITKLVGEEYARAYKQNYNLDYSIVRLFSVYGENQAEKFVIPKFTRLILKDEAPLIFGDGKQIRSFCHVDDAAYGAVLALLSEKSNSQIFNIGNSSEPVTMRELAEKMIVLSGKSIRPQFVDFEKSDRDARREIYWRIPSIEKAKKILGYEPKIHLHDGLKRMLTPISNGYSISNDPIR